VQLRRCAVCWFTGLSHCELSCTALFLLWPRRVVTCPTNGAWKRGFKVGHGFFY
jgi:hypothetical protein